MMDNKQHHRDTLTSDSPLVCELLSNGAICGERSANALCCPAECAAR